MPPAARVGDSTTHPGTIIGPGVASVLIGGLPAAVLGDSHACILVAPPPHTAASVIIKGSSTVLIGNRPAARMGDLAGCGSMIVQGAPNTEIGG
jgi:uncharacterized Zn-binding protein involved in type VI secretion